MIRLLGIYSGVCAPIHVRKCSLQNYVDEIAFPTLGRQSGCADHHSSVGIV